MTERHPALYWTADRSELVEEGDVRAAFLAYAPYDPVPPEMEERMGGKPSKQTPADRRLAENKGQPPRPQPPKK